MIHELKIDKQYFDAVIENKKTFEVRKNDRDFHVGDFLALNEMFEGAYTGRSVLTLVRYILDEPEYCKDGFITMGIKLCGVTHSANYGPRIVLTREEAADEY